MWPPPISYFRNRRQFGTLSNLHIWSQRERNVYLETVQFMQHHFCIGGRRFFLGNSYLAILAIAIDHFGSAVANCQIDLHCTVTLSKAHLSGNNTPSDLQILRLWCSSGKCKLKYVLRNFEFSLLHAGRLPRHIALWKPRTVGFLPTEERAVPLNTYPPIEWPLQNML